MQSASDLDNEDCLIDEAKELHGKLEEVLKDTKMKITGILKILLFRVFKYLPFTSENNHQK